MSALDLDIPSVGTPGSGYATRINQALQAVEDYVNSFGLNVTGPNFGAVGDGATDDTAAIQEALNESGSGTTVRRLVFVPPGRYRISQLVVPLGVHFGGIGYSGFATPTGYEYGSMLQQIAGTEDDLIIFETDAVAPYYIGPQGVTGFELKGDPTASAGSGIAVRNASGQVGKIRDTVKLHNILVRGFAEDGIKIPGGAIPLHLHDIEALWNQRYGINYIAGVNNTQAVHFDNISGDGNIDGLIRCKSVDARGSILFTNIKSEKRLNDDYGDAVGQEHAIVLEDCDGTPVHVAGVTHLSSVPDGGQFEAPGAAISISGTGRPKVTWEGVAVRVHTGGETGGPGPVLEDAANSVVVPNGQSSGSYGVGGDIVAHARVPGSGTKEVLGGLGTYNGPATPNPGYQLQGVTPAFLWYESDGAADQKHWGSFLSSGGHSLRRYSDALALLETVINVGATGDYAISRAVANFTPLFIPIGGLLAITGTPAYGIVGGGRRQGLLFDGAANESAAGQFVVPPGWQTASVTVLWCNAGGGAGDVNWLFQGDDWVEGNNLNAADTQNTSGSETAGAQDILVSTPLTTASITLAGGRLFTFRIVRQATDGSDTLANDAALVGIVLTRLT
ncbi:MAG: glycosyl hydrolase family 28-related protein [Acidimicrobiales bacterium]|nr:glycosyl hydrolase family 28-related protein [Acidimicrobiales bacterium]